MSIFFLSNLNQLFSEEFLRRWHKWREKTRHKRIGNVTKREKKLFSKIFLTFRRITSYKKRTRRTAFLKILSKVIRLFSFFFILKSSDQWAYLIPNFHSEKKARHPKISFLPVDHFSKVPQNPKVNWKKFRYFGSISQCPKENNIQSRSLEKDLKHR